MGNSEEEREEVRRCIKYTGSMPCNASPEEGIINGGGGLGAKLKCPASISRLRVEKIEGGLMVAGVVVAANCQIALPAFGFLFVLVGSVLTAASYRGPGEDEDKDSYAARIAFTGNSRILGPICIAVGLLMLALGALLCSLTRRARRRERRVGFHCPLHGDFYPLSPAQGAKIIGKNVNGWTKIPCFRGGGRAATTHSVNGANLKFGSRIGPPQCPHSVLSSTRSSVSSSPLSPCPTPMPFLVTSGSMSSGMVQISAGANLSPDQTFGSIRSLSVTREVASFPLSRTPTPPPQHRPNLQPASITSEDQLSPQPPQPPQPPAPSTTLHPLNPTSGTDSPKRDSLQSVSSSALSTSSPRPELRVLAPSHRRSDDKAALAVPQYPATGQNRKSVSIVLPDEPLG